MRGDGVLDPFTYAEGLWLRLNDSSFWLIIEEEEIRYIISAAELLCRVLAYVSEKLSVQRDWQAFSTFDQGDLLCEIRTDGNDVDTKLRQTESFCKQLGIEITDCMAIGDGANDVRLFQATGNGVTFKDSKYADTASARRSDWATH